MTTQSLTVEHDRPQLQLALDFVSLNDALRTASAVHPHFDIAEIGTPLIIEEGLRALEELKARWPEKRFLARATWGHPPMQRWVRRPRRQKSVTAGQCGRK